MPDDNPIIQVEITDPEEFHCFRITLRAFPGEASGEREPLEILLHATALVELIHQCNLALSEWQKAGTEYLLGRVMGAVKGIAQADVVFLLQVQQAAVLAAGYDWRTSVAEAEHNQRIAAMNHLRETLSREGPG